MACISASDLATGAATTLHRAAQWPDPTSPCSSSIPASAGCRCSRRSARCCRTRRSSMPPTTPAFPTAPRARPRSRRACRRCSAGWPSAIDPRLIVIACNTASTIALDAVRAALDLPIVGTVPGDQAGRGAVEDPRDRRARHRRDHRASPMSTGSPPSSPPTASCSATARPSWSSWPRRSCAARPADPAAYRAHAGRPARPARRRADRHGRPRLHAFPAGRGRARRPPRRARSPSSTAATGIARRIAMADPRPVTGRTRPARASPSSPRLDR